MNNTYQTTKIKSVEIETPKVKNFILDSSIKAEPGQYVMIWLPGFNEKPFGIVKPSPLMLSIAKIGPTTEIIHKLKVGDKVTFRGPYGQSFKIKRFIPFNNSFNKIIIQISQLFFIFHFFN